MSIRNELRGLFPTFEAKNDWKIKEAEDNLTKILSLIGEQPDREGLLKTPATWMKNLIQATEGYQSDPPVILSAAYPTTKTEINIRSNIEFSSIDEETLLPFTGEITIAYLPNGWEVGPSKLHGLVYCLSKRLQSRARLPQEIGEAISNALKPFGVGIICKSSGPYPVSSVEGKPGGWTITTYYFSGEITKENVENGRS